MRKQESSNSRIEFRLTEAEKNQIKEAAAARDMTVSEFIRYACEKIFNKEEI